MIFVLFGQITRAFRVVDGVSMDLMCNREVPIKPFGFRHR